MYYLERHFPSPTWVGRGGRTCDLTGNEVSKHFRLEPFFLGGYSNVIKGIDISGALDTHGGCITDGESKS